MRLAPTALLYLLGLVSAGLAFAQAPAPETYAGPPVPFLGHVHGIWRGIQQCPQSHPVLPVTLSVVQLGKPDKFGGAFQLGDGTGVAQGPLRVSFDADARTMHVRLLNPQGSLNGELDVQMSASGDRLKQVKNPRPSCTDIEFARQVDPRAAGASSGPPVITHISDLAATQHQHIVVRGSGFGTHAPILGESVLFAIQDHSALPREWNASFAGDVPPDVLTLSANVWTDSEIQSAGFFTGYGPFLHLSPGDRLTFYVWNAVTLAGPATFDVTVTDYPPDADTLAIDPECKDRARPPEVRLRACSALIEKQPGLAVLYRLRGVASLKAGQYDAAMTDFDKALALDARMATALAGRGQVLSAQGKQKEAIAQGFTPALALDAHLPDVLWQRGLTYEVLEDFQLALKDAEAALAIDGHHLPAIRLRGLVLIELGRYQDAADSLAQAAMSDETDWRLDYLGALARAWLGASDRAERLMRAACDGGAPKELDACGKADTIAGQNGGGFDILSILHRSGGFDVAAALAQFRKVVSLR